MFEKITDRIRSRLRRHNRPRPLVSLDYDVALVRRAFRRRWPRVSQLLHIRRILSPGERRLWHWSMAILVIGVIWGGWVSLGRYRTLVPAVGGRYVEAVVGSPQLANPLFASLNDVDSDLSRLMYSGLMRYDEKLRLVPDLAVSSTVSANKKVYTFELRRDAVWHDTEPFTAEDVIFTFQTIQDQSVASPLSVTFQGVQVKAIDDYRVEFTLTEPFAPFLSALTVGILPEHIWANVQGDRIRLHRRNLQPIGTGPFMFKKLTKDDTGYISRYELVRFDRYYRRPAYVEDIAFQFFSSYDGETGALQALRTQQVDGVHFVPYDLKEKVQRKHIVVHTVQLPQYTALFFNKDHQPFFKEAGFRQALEESIDKDRLINDALRGEGEVIWSPVLPTSPGYKADLPHVSYSVEEANKRLDALYPRLSTDEYRAIRRAELEAALPVEASIVATSTEVIAVGEIISTTTSVTTSTTVVGALLDEELNTGQTFYRKQKEKDGRVISITIVTADTPEYRKTAQLVAGFWQEVGVKTNVEYVSPRDMTRTVLRTREYDVLLYGAILGGDPDLFPLWHSSQIDFPGLNLARYVNRAVDEFLAKARVATTDQERAEAYTKIEETILIDRPAIFLYSPTYRYATIDKMKGVEIEHMFHPSDRLNSAVNWYIKTRWQWHW